MHLTMPNKLEHITVKIIGKVIKSGEKKPRFHCPVHIWGDPKKNIFQLEITSTLWKSLDSELVSRYELGGDANEELDDDLEILIGKIITITGIPDINRAYIKKDGSVDSPKIFDATIRDDLEEAERTGGDLYTQKVEKENRISRSCINANMRLVDEEEIKRLEREIKIEKRKDEKTKKNIKDIEDYLLWS